MKAAPSSSVVTNVPTPIEHGCILLTDRHGPRYRLPRDLCLLASFAVVALNDPVTIQRNPRIIVFDIPLIDTNKVRLLRNALERLRKPGTPLVCVIESETHHNVTQAQALGASDILMSEPRVQLLARVAELIHLYPALGMMETRQHKEQIARKGAVATGLALGEMMAAAQQGNFISSEVLNSGCDAVLDAIQRADISAWLDVVWSYDDVTYQHCLLVAGLAATFGFKLGFHADDLRRLARAALIHDIGKSKIPAKILNKPDRLTENEMAIMHTHAAIGFDMLVHQGGFEPDLLAVVRHHHEYLDGTGYPDGLSGMEIPDLVRLTTICDIYAALIERRVYKTAMLPHKAFQIMHGMGDKLDRGLLYQFCSLLAPATLPSLTR